MIRVAIVTTDNREHHRRYELVEPYFGTAVEALLQGFVGVQNLEVDVISCCQQPMKSPKQLASNISFHSLYVPKIGWLRTGYAGCVRVIRAKLRELRPDVVHGQGTERECALSAVKSGFPNVITIHGNMLGVARALDASFGSFYWLAARLEGYALKRTDGVLCNSAYTEKLVRARTGARTWRVPNALRQIFFKELPDRIAQPKPILLNIGSISPHKCQIEILEVARRLFAAGHFFQIQFIGGFRAGDAYGDRFRNLVEAGKRDGYADYIEPKSDQDLLRIYDSAAALVHLPTEEAFGLVLAEALSRNLKVFAARVGGIPDITAGVDTAELYDQGDWEGLYNGLSTWILTKSLQRSESAALMKERYHPNIVSREHLRVYREVLNSPS